MNAQQAPKELTKAEEQIMHVIWKLGKGYFNDIMEAFPEPKPAYKTAATVVRILEQKGFVSHVAHGRNHEYFPLVSKEIYTRDFLKNFTRHYFSNSHKTMASFFAHKEDLSLKELEEIRQIVDKRIEEQKTSKP